MRTAPSLPSHQRGALLILLVIALGILAVTVFVGMLSSSEIQIDRDKKTAAALAEAKAALIGWSVANKTTPGVLPCPDTNNDGVAESSCSTASQQIGRFPWKTLGIPDLRDGSGERLWYVLSADVRNGLSTNSVIATGQLNVTGTETLSNVVAIIFAPGAAISPSAGAPLQQRDTPNQNTVSNYLEGSNADGDTTYVANPASQFFNDNLLAITHKELFVPVERRIAYEIVGVNTTPSNALRGYYSIHGNYPFATDSPSSNNNKQQTRLLNGQVPFNDPDYLVSSLPMLKNNKWFDLATYSIPVTLDSANIQLRYCNASSSTGAVTDVICP